MSSLYLCVELLAGRYLTRWLVVGAVEHDPSLFPSSSLDSINLLHLPGMWKVSVPLSELSSTLPSFLTDPENAKGASKLAFQHILLVCVHLNRDSRCGTLGPLIVSALIETVAREGLESTVKVLGCSHVGGHKYAGNLICYPRGDWFGRIAPWHSDAVIGQYVEEGRLLKELWRGRVGM